MYLGQINPSYWYDHFCQWWINMKLAMIPIKIVLEQPIFDEMPQCRIHFNCRNIIKYEAALRTIWIKQNHSKLYTKEFEMIAVEYHLSKKNIPINYRLKCTQRTFNDTISRHSKFFLCLSNHQSNQFLLFHWHFIPQWIIAHVTDIECSFGESFRKITVHIAHNHGGCKYIYINQ